MVNSLNSRLLIAAALLLVSCANSPEQTASIETPTSTASPLLPPPEESPSSVSPTAAPEAIEPEPTTITTAGIGAARLGMTLGELKQALGDNVEFTVQSPFIVDFDAIAVSQAGEVQYYILYMAGQPFGDDGVIQGLLTDNPKYQTAEAVGAGTLVSEAESAYGNATLSYNQQNESREYVRFERQPASNISFATGNANQQLAGIYTAPIAEFNETEAFQSTATIKSVLVVCLAEACAAPVGAMRG
jgi:hypothetical protein